MVMVRSVGSGRVVTVSDLSDVVIRLGAVAGALYAIWALLRLAVVIPIRKSINAEVEPVTEQLKEVEQKMTNLDVRMSDHIATHGPPNARQ